ncbi:MFS general substrate transporter [Aureobasidium pullulans]|uniref:MFS general substrate transporter n=1 Tax=Aureobasidium pullulans TaxID=5580 RepID=A0A4V4I1L3_AURPU|nr:MFS general substrate transporter [Aureobasidium pullulans]
MIYIGESISKMSTASMEKEPETITSPPQDEEEAASYLTGLTLLSVVVSLVLVIFLMMLDTSIVATAIPRITTQFHSLEDVGWYGSAYLLANCALQPLAGKIYKEFSYKWAFLWFFGLFEVGSLLCGVATSSNMFIVGRAVAGLGCAGLINGALSIIAASVPLTKRPLYMGFMMSLSQFGVLFGPLIGGALTEYTTWRWCFYINLPVGGIVAVILFFAPVPAGPEKTVDKKFHAGTFLRSLDLVGFALFAPAIIQILLALQWGGTQYAWNSATVIGLFCGGAATLLVFLTWEYFKGDDAMIPLSMVRQRIFWSSCMTVFFTFSSMLCVNYYLPIYFQAVRGASPTMSGVDLLPSIISQMIFAILSGIGVTKVGYYLPFSIACGILTAISAGLLGLLGPHTSMAKWIGYQILGGVGRGLGIQMPIVAIQNLVPKSQASVAMSLLIFSQTFGGALFLAFAQTVFNTGLSSALKEYAPEVAAETILAAGATGVRGVVSGSVLPHVLQAYSQAIDHVFYLSAGAAAGATLACLGMGWKSIKKAKAEAATAESVPEKEVGSVV